MILPLSVALAFQSGAVGARLRRAIDSAGARVQSCVDLSGGSLDPQGASVLFIEDRDDRDTISARVVTLAGVHRDTLLVLIVEPSAWDPRLFGDGAFDVICDGPDLERDVTRTLALAARVLTMQRERIRLANDMAHQDRLSALGLLAAGVGHEVNNPSAAILANVELIRDQLEATLTKPRYQQADALNSVAGEWLEALGDCLGASRRIVSIVRSLNVFSRRGEDLSPRVVNINEEISTVMRLIGKEVHFQSHVELDLDSTLPSIFTTPHAITQIVTNLVVNALQALESVPREDRRLVVRTSFDDESVLIEVNDNGPGIPAEHMDRIFDPFFTTKGVGIGTGLGLSITRQLVQRAGGEVMVESSPGTGASFQIVFERPDPATMPSSRASRLPPASDRLRVLVVDDDELLLRSLKRLLDGQFEIVPAKSASHALRLLAEDDRLDVILTDIVMPDESGVDLFDQLEVRFPRLAKRTIFISGGIRSEELRARIERTGRPFVAKPIEIRELARLVRAVERGIAA